MSPSDANGIELPIDLDVQVTDYLHAVRHGERSDAIAIAVGLLAIGVNPETIITDLLARAMREIGLGWQEGTWSIALEHRASTITESVLQTLTDTALLAPGAVPEESRGRAVVACSEGEWHTLPGRMAAELLRLRGADVSFIGPSVPGGELAAMLDYDPPVAVAITCSMPMSLTGTWRTISSLRALGMTILCGGRGFGPEGRWGLALGADIWAVDFATGADLLLDALAAPAPPPRAPVGAPDVVEEIRILQRQHEILVEAALAISDWPDPGDSDPALRSAREDLSSTLRVVAAATLVGDPAIVVDHAEWYSFLSAARGRPRSLASLPFERILVVLPRELPLARAMATIGLMAHSADPA